MTGGVAIVAGADDAGAMERAARYRRDGAHVDLVLRTAGGAYRHELDDTGVVHRLPPTPAAHAEWGVGLPLRDAAHLDALAHAEVVGRLLERIHAVRPLAVVELHLPGAGCLPDAPAGVPRRVRGGARAAEGPGTVGERVRDHLIAAAAADAPDADGAAPADTGPLPAAPGCAPGPAGDGRLAVVVLAYNGLAYTRRCITSVLAHGGPGLRVVLVDNASTDGTVAWARRVAAHDARLTVCALPTNRGVPGGRNAGLAVLDVAALDAVAFLDNDVEVGAGWSGPFLERLAADPGVGVVGEEGYVAERHAAGLRLTPRPGRSPRECDVVVGYCMVVRAAAVRTVGPFDEGLGLFWHDDDDYCLRAQAAGWRVVRLETGRVLHYGHASSTPLRQIWTDAQAGRASGLSERNRRRVAAKLAGLVQPPPPAEVTSPYVLAVDLDAADRHRVAAAVAGRATVVGVRVTRDAPPVHARVDGHRRPTRAAAGGRELVDPLGPEDAAVVADGAWVVVGAHPGRLGGVPVVAPDALAEALSRPVAPRRPWRRPD